MARDFKKIVAWQRADALVMEVYRATKSAFPQDEKYGLRSQIRSAAVSVAANIAEGSGVGTPAGFRRYSYHAQGSLSEVEYYIHLAENLGYISKETVGVLSSRRSEVGRTLQGFIRALDHQIIGPGSDA
jgi:four helix bundle protein